MIDLALGIINEWLPKQSLANRLDHRILLTVELNHTQSKQAVG